MYILIIILIALFLDYLFRLTVRKTRKKKIKEMAEKRARETGKPLVIFNNRYNGSITDYTGTKKVEEYTGDVVDISKQMADNSCVIIVSETLEYIDSELSKTIERLQAISGGDLYAVNIESTSPRTLWDYKISNIMDKSFYLPKDKISWSEPNDLQRRTQKFYFWVFKIIPYQFFAYDPIQG